MRSGYLQTVIVASVLVGGCAPRALMIGARDAGTPSAASVPEVAIIQEAGPHHDWREVYFTKALTTRLMANGWRVFWSTMREETKTYSAAESGEVMAKAARSQSLSTVLETKAPYVIFIYSDIRGDRGKGQYALRMVDRATERVLLSMNLRVSNGGGENALEEWASTVARYMTRLVAEKGSVIEELGDGVKPIPKPLTPLE